ncbi:hypothetical protein BV22DRAFT_296229 [Leucogyrophana mollusca]|uniref:Uncharacterized protein n=1 Tax=Leucogyrophana mollusca TaxID=85980 RepID=A0ACB8BMZ2_9AGAM|nr:hypothetical protein BV22DRAFT_296229 [Leucogyrophana mollusca]
MAPAARSTRSTSRGVNSRSGLATKENDACHTSPLLDTPGAATGNSKSRASPGRRARHRMTSMQLARLEQCFQQDTHPSREKKKNVADELRM